MAHARQTCLRMVAACVACRAHRALALAALLAGLIDCAPDVPHAVSSRTDVYCRQCHVGRAGAPSSHDKAGCVSCHEGGSTGVYPTCMPHPGGETDRCQLCHADGTFDAPKTKHLDQADCYTCHQAPEYGAWPPGVPHEVADPGPARCLECHKDLDHADRPSCVGCHGS